MKEEALRLADEYKDRECWGDVEYQQWCEDAEDTLRKLVKEIERLEDIRNHYVERIGEVSKPASSKLQDEIDKITGKWVAK